MITLSKLFSREYYFRKYIAILKKFSNKQHIEYVQFIHDIKASYYYTFQKRLHLVQPRNFNEKLIWLSLYWQHPLKTLCADKIKFREYVVNTCQLPEDLLVPILGTYQRAEDIDFTSLPEQFVLKCNHGCGYNLIVKDKATLNQKAAMETLNQWVNEDFRAAISELHYKAINPQVIYCEQFLTALGDESIVDYKIHCFNGKPDFVLVCYNRNEAQEAELATFSFDWKQLYYVVDEETIDIVRPDSLDKMVEYARVLSQDFPFVRVDFYDVKGKPLLGELTFTPYGNMITYYKPEIIDLLGKKLTLPKKYKGAY